MAVPATRTTRQSALATRATGTRTRASPSLSHRRRCRIAAAVATTLGDARTVLNVGAGAGSYEPRDRIVTAVEPSAAMRAQRPAGIPTAIDATAEALPLPDNAFDAAMTTFSVHQ